MTSSSSVASVAPALMGLDVSGAPDAMQYPAPGSTFTQTILETGPDGRARWRLVRIALDQGNAAARLSAPMAVHELQLRHSPAGYASDFHCTTQPQWLIVLSGRMEVRLQDGSRRLFSAGQHFYSADLLPEGAVFDASVHGHASCALDGLPLITAFIRG